MYSTSVTYRPVRQPSISTAGIWAAIRIIDHFDQGLFLELNIQYPLPPPCFLLPPPSRKNPSPTSTQCRICSSSIMGSYEVIDNIRYVPKLKAQKTIISFRKVEIESVGFLKREVSATLFPRQTKLVIVRALVLLHGVRSRIFRTMIVDEMQDLVAER